MAVLFGRFVDPPKIAVHLLEGTWTRMNSAGTVLQPIAGMGCFFPASLSAI